MGLFSAAATVYPSFTTEGQGSWERQGSPGIVGGTWLTPPGPWETDLGRVFLGKHASYGGFREFAPTGPEAAGCLGRMTFSVWTYNVNFGPFVFALGSVSAAF